MLPDDEPNAEMLLRAVTMNETKQTQYWDKEYLKEHWTSIASSPDFFQKKLGILYH